MAKATLKKKPAARDLGPRAAIANAARLAAGRPQSKALGGGSG